MDKKRLVIKALHPAWHRAFLVGAALCGETTAGFVIDLMKDRKELRAIARKEMKHHGGHGQTAHIKGPKFSRPKLQEVG